MIVKERERSISTKGKLGKSDQLREGSSRSGPAVLFEGAFVGGPITTVMLGTEMTQDFIDEIRAYAVPFFDPGYDLSSDSRDYVIIDGEINESTLFGGERREESRPIALYQYPPEFHEDFPTRAGLSALFGTYPVSEICLSASVNAPEDYLVLGELTLRVSERFHGFIKFGGALYPPRTKKIDWINGPDWSEFEDDFQGMIETMPGVIHGIPYRTDTGRSWVRHFSDNEFLRAWIRHPHFNLVK